MLTSATLTYRKRPLNNRHGFTLIEMIVVVTVLALVSLMVMPYLAGMQGSSVRREAVAGVRRIAGEARERAIRSGRSTEVTYDESASELLVSEIADEGESRVLVRQPLPEGLDPQAFQVEGGTTSGVDFRLLFTSDGKSNGGGIEFSEFSIYVDQNGHWRLVDGPLPTADEEKWQAGDLEQRL